MRCMLQTLMAVCMQQAHTHDTHVTVGTGEAWVDAVLMALHCKTECNRLLGSCVTHTRTHLVNRYHCYVVHHLCFNQLLITLVHITSHTHRPPASVCINNRAIPSSSDPQATDSLHLTTTTISATNTHSVGVGTGLTSLPGVRCPLWR